MLDQTQAPWAAWIVVAAMAAAAVIDGRTYKIPNWLTFPLAASGLAYSAWVGGAAGLAWSAAGLAVGLGLLLPLYAIGGLGAGDVKQYAGFGAWVGPVLAANAFAVAAIVGGAIALGMIARSGHWRKHWSQAVEIGREVVTVRDPALLAASAEVRRRGEPKLPYGVPLSIGAIGYLAWIGMLS